MTQNRRFQYGSLFKRGTRTKMWVARWWEDLVGPDGKSERIRRSEVLGTVAELPTRREAEQLLSDRLRGINSGDSRVQSTWTLKSFIQDRWLPDVLPTIKYSTQIHYKYIVKVHLIPTLGDMQLRLITRESVQSLLTSKRRSGLSWRTVKHIHTTFGTILAAAEMEGLVPEQCRAQDEASASWSDCRESSNRSEESVRTSGSTSGAVALFGLVAILFRPAHRRIAGAPLA